MAKDCTASPNRPLAGQTTFVAPTSWDGETVTRCAFLHPATSLDAAR